MVSKRRAIKLPFMPSMNGIKNVILSMLGMKRIRDISQSTHSMDNSEDVGWGVYGTDKDDS